MQKLPLRNVDLNLLVVFDTIMLERSITRASERLSLSESAVSHALGRLRRCLKDELFTRDRSGLHATPRANQLRVPVRRALQRIESALSFKPFVPSEARRTFRLAAGDCTCSLLVPSLVESLEREAPLIDLVVIPLSRQDIIRQLDDGMLDFAISWVAAVPERLRRTTLFHESYLLLVRRGHPLSQRKVTPARVLGFPHVTVDFSGNGENVMEGFLSERGVLRRVRFEQALTEAPQRLRARGRIAVTVPTFWEVPPILEKSNMVASIPRRLAKQMCERYALTALQPPFDRTPIAVELLWHQRAEADLGLRWFRQHLEKIAAAVARHEEPRARGLRPLKAPSRRKAIMGT